MSTFSRLAPSWYIVPKITSHQAILGNIAESRGFRFFASVQNQLLFPTTILQQSTIFTNNSQLSQNTIWLANSNPLSHPNSSNILVQAKPATTGTTKLSSTWNGGTSTPSTYLGIVKAGEGTAKSAKAPAMPKSKPTATNAASPPGITPFTDTLLDSNELFYVQQQQ